jgi:hypothetical protein
MNVKERVAEVVRWTQDGVQTSWAVPPIPAWLVGLLAALLVVTFLVSYRAGLWRGQGLVRRLLAPLPWTARAVISDGSVILDGEHQRLLDALGGGQVLAASSVAALTNLAWHSVKEVAGELEDLGLVAVGRFRVGGDWELALTAKGRQALRTVKRTGRRSPTAPPRPVAPPLPSPRVSAAGARPARTTGEPGR